MTANEQDWAVVFDIKAIEDGIAKGDFTEIGGAKVLDALEEAFELPAGGLEQSRSVLRDYGNMSAATVLFVLQRILRDRRAKRHLLTSLGPGFSAGFLLLQST